MSDLKCCPDPCDLPDGCINPLIYLFKRTIAAMGPEDSMADVLDATLANGIVITGATNFCCSDCTDTNGFYYLGGFLPFRDILIDRGFTTEIGSDPLEKYPCCVNKSTSKILGDLYTQLLTTPDELDPTVYTVDKRPVCCEDSFSEAVNQMLSETGVDFVVNTNSGIFEASQFNKVSGITIILNFLKSLTPSLTFVELTDVFSVIIETGIYVKCDGCNITIGNGQLALEPVA